MSHIKPFRAFRPKPELAAEVASVPYDVINSVEARQLAQGKPHSFLHVGRPEINLPEGVDEHSDDVYAAGVKALKGFISDGTLFQDDKPCFYVYKQKMGSHAQAGLVCLCSVKEYESNLIKKHEYTRKDKEDDRTRHVTEQGANAEPVFLTYPAAPYIDQTISKAMKAKPAYDFDAPDGIGHTVWVINDESVIHSLTNLFSGIKALYIADGHHRTAAAIRYGQAKRAEAGNDATGNEPFEYFMAVVFPHDQLKIMDYNRVVKDLNGLSKDQFIEKIKEKFDVGPNAEKKPKSLHSFGMFLDGQWHLLTAKPGTWDSNDHVKSLDVSILQDNLLQPILGIQDPRTDKRIDFIGGIRGTEELEKRVNEGSAVAFAMFPTSLTELMAVSDAGQIMPPKSTWFEPKLRSGLLVRIYES
ncbi:MAG: DUF1015 family protein [Holophagales bacterium]|jgi:uncharacterized protein (DUF1015 family)|nr:DUF1015 family protein [Holophagales bacterium]